MAATTPAPLALWGGVECTVNRVGDRYRDQAVLTGHHARADDLDRIAALGVRTVRYPVLWERTACGPDAFDWTWPDARLARLQRLGIDSIVGLVHHGSGPPWTSLLDQGFATGLARFARLVAQRYPWVRRFTPVNEPLTTARFSALYGHWYPHRRDDASFVRALLVQCRATVLAAAAIREVTPDAEIVLTDDICRVSSTPAMDGWERFYNDRRWLSFDLLFGRVDRQHPLRDYLLASGAREDELDAFVAAPLDRAIVGLNYYLTSDRYLDDRLELYPPDRRDAAVPFVDVEASRVGGCGPAGHEALLLETWQRYQRPVAVTEVHLGCSREEQLRWLGEAWQGALAARAQGADVLAITAWALFGSVDWNSLVTEDRGHYEPGVFDTRGGAVRPTALAAAVRELAQTGRLAHPAAEGPGWWRREELRAWVQVPGHRRRDTVTRSVERRARPVLITGATGTLGRATARLCALRGLAYRLVGRSDMDIANADDVARVVDALRPWAVINTAGFVRVDDAEHEPDRCWRENVDGPAVLAEVAAARRLPLVTFSSDLVFDGDADAPYTEGDAVRPLSVYGRSKAEAERRVLEACPDALVVRTAAFFGPWDHHNAVIHAIRAMCEGRPHRVPGDAVVSPTYVPDLVSACLDLLIDGEFGVWHLANDGAVSWVDLSRAAASRLGLDAALIEPCLMADLGMPALRPRFSALGTERAQVMPSLDSALDRYAREAECLPPQARRL